MENSAASGEPNKKRPHLNPLVSSPMPRHTLSSSDSKPVDAAVLQYENQKLVRQLDVQKQELHDLEEKMKELQVKQAAYDDILISINRLWNKVDDNMILLGAKVGADPRALQSLSHADHSRGSIPSCLAEEMFLCRILNKDFIESSGSGVSITDVKEALDFRCSYTRELMTSLKDALDAQSSKLEEVANALDVIPSAEDAIALSSKIDDLLKDEASVLHDAIDVLLQKHKEYANVIEIYAQDPTDQSELKRLEVELEESMAELEESRRKLVNLKMQKEAASAREQPVLGSVNWSVSPEYTERTMDVQELKDSIEETQVLADDRLIELQDAKDDNSVLLKQLQDLKTKHHPSIKGKKSKIKFPSLSLKDNKNPELWSRVDAIVLQWIYGTISDDLLNTILERDSTAELAWNRLEDIFLDNKNSRALYLEQEFSAVRMEQFTDASSYCQHLKTLADQLSNVGAPVSNNRLVLQLVSGLTDAYAMVGSQIRHEDPLPLFYKARSMIILEETAMAKKIASPYDTALHATADEQIAKNFWENQGGRGGRTSGFNSRGGSSIRGGGYGNSKFSRRKIGLLPLCGMGHGNLGLLHLAHILPHQPSGKEIKHKPPQKSILGPKPSQAHLAATNLGQSSYASTDIQQAMHTLSIAPPV
nr:E3 ubiquitin-protein ligase BRE1-like 2 isoform X1 [Ipomoea batatas]